MMNNRTTVEADPKGAVSFLRALKQKTDAKFRPDQYKLDWFTRSSQEVRERLGRDSLWDNPSPTGIGWDYERLVGANIGASHPVVDSVYAYEGVVTSMKTMDTHAITYENGENLYRVGKRYVDAFEKFTGVSTVDGFVLPLDQIRGFHLEIGVRTDMTVEQREGLRRVQGYGQEKNVRVIIAEVA